MNTHIGSKLTKIELETGVFIYQMNQKSARPCGKNLQIYSNTKGVQNYDYHTERRIQKRIFRSKIHN